MKEKRFITFLLTTLLILGFSASRATADNELRVRCIDQDGNPLEDVEVYIQGILQQMLDDDDSNDDGIAEFKKLDDDFYRTWAHHEGYAPAFEEFINLRGDEKLTVDLVFRPGDSEQMLYFEDQAVLQEATTLLREGAVAIQSQDFVTAEGKLEESLKINPSDPNAHFNLALAYLEQGKWEPAKEQFEKVLALMDFFTATEDPSNPVYSRLQQESENLMGSIPLRRLAFEADKAMKEFEWDTAIDRLEQLAEHQPDNANVYYMMSIALIRSNKVDEAEERLDLALQLSPEEEAFTELKQKIEEIQAGRAANEERAKVAAVQELNQNQQYAEALEKAQEVMDTVSEELQINLWASITNSHLGLKQYDQALEAYQKNLEMSGESVDEGLFQLGEQFVKSGEQEPARKAFQAVLEVNPEYAEAYYQLGMDYFYELNDKEKAKEMLEKYIELGEDEDKINNAKNVLVVMEKS